MEVSNVLDDIKAVLHKIENAIGAHNAGTLTPTHLAEARDAAQAAITNAEVLVATPQGDPVPDSGTGGAQSTAGSVQKPTDEEIAAAGTADVGKDDAAEGDSTTGSSAKGV